VVAIFQLSSNDTQVLIKIYSHPASKTVQCPITIFKHNGSIIYCTVLAFTQKLWETTKISVEEPIKLDQAANRVNSQSKV
jgi:hypothetical protein